MIGNYIEIEITKYPSKLDDSIYGKVIHTIGEKSKKGIHTDLAIKLYELPHEWPEDVLKEITVYNNYEDEDQEVYTSRKDLRHINFITIDGADAKDFDDAVFCHPSENGWKLFITSLFQHSAFILLCSIVLPFTVKAFLCINFFSKSCLITAGTPPA